MRVPLAASAFLLLAFVPLVAAQGGGAGAGVRTTTTYYLHLAGDCSGQGKLVTSMDTNDSKDVDGCFNFGASGAAGGGFEESYPAGVPVGLDLGADSKAALKLFVATAQPDQVKVTMTLTSGTASCKAASGEQTTTNVFNPVTGATTYTTFDVACTLSGKGAAADRPRLDLVVASHTSYSIGYEGDHTSTLKVEGTMPTPPATETTPAPVGQSPGPGAFVVLAAASLALAAAARRRA